MSKSARILQARIAMLSILISRWYPMISQWKCTSFQLLFWQYKTTPSLIYESLNMDLLKQNALAPIRTLKKYTLKVTCVKPSCHSRQALSLAWYQSIDFQTSYFLLLSHTAPCEGLPYIRVYYLMQSYTLLLLSLFTLSTPNTPRVPALPSQCF